MASIPLNNSTSTSPSVAPTLNQNLSPPVAADSEKFQSLAAGELPANNGLKNTAGSENSINPPSEHKRQRPHRPQQLALAAAGSGTASAQSKDKNIGITQTISGGTPAARILTVSENGEGGSYLLTEALRSLRPGDKIFLRKGHYKQNLNIPDLPDFSISGEGPDSVLELNETFRVHHFNLAAENLKIIYYGNGEAISVAAGKKLVISKILLKNNGNDGIAINQAHLQASELTVQTAQHGLLFKNPLTIQIDRIQISDSDFGMQIAGEKNLSVSNLEVKNSHIRAVFFVDGSRGKLTCYQCRLGDSPSNHADRLVLKDGGVSNSP